VARDLTLGQREFVDAINALCDKHGDEAAFEMLAQLGHAILLMQKASPEELSEARAELSDHPQVSHYDELCRLVRQGPRERARLMMRWYTPATSRAVRGWCKPSARPRARRRHGARRASGIRSGCDPGDDGESEPPIADEGRP